MLYFIILIFQLDNYHLRKNLLKETFDNMYCDVIGLQEVSFLKNNQLNDLNFPTANINEIFSKESNIISNKGPKKIYKQYCSESQINIKQMFPNQDKEFNIDGNAILSSYEFEKNKNGVIYLSDHKILHLSAERVAHMLIYNFYESELRIIFVNCHLHHVIDDENIRLYQTKNLHKWIDYVSKETDFVFVVGDFNALPEELTYKYFQTNGFFSVHKEFYGREPEKTFHNKMEAPFKDCDPEGTFDYIL